jgi:adenosylcobinamide-GDP ribazoletransferase
LHARAETVRTARRPWGGLAAAVSLLTIVPVPVAADAGLASAAGWFPLVGAAVGGLAGGVRVGCEPLVGRTVATVLAMIVLVIMTGALHLDGLADTADGMGARGDVRRRLEVMRDSATGVYGTLAVVAWALLMLTAVASLDADRALRALIAAGALARLAALLHAAGTRPARADGLGAAFEAPRRALIAGTATAIAVALAICGAYPGAVAVGAALLVSAASIVFARRTLGGRTGDTLGATVALAEAAVCTVLLSVWLP